MTCSAWRIVKSKHAADALTGEGAKKFGGRWNSPGMAAVYTAGSISLAMLEMLVHLQSEELLKSYVVFRVEFDESLLADVDSEALPTNWRESPPPHEVQQLGDAWIAEGNSCVLRVPSTIVPTEWNYLINPAHADFRNITIGPEQRLQFDSRLIKAT